MRVNNVCTFVGYPPTRGFRTHHMGVLDCRAIYRDCRIVGSFVGFVGMSDAFPDMDEHRTAE
eukprot:1722406-Prymnesium_polylepis.1